MRRRLAVGAAVSFLGFGLLNAAAFGRWACPRFRRRPLLLFWGGVQQGFKPFRLNPVDDASGVHSPALLMQGDQDPSITMEELRFPLPRRETLIE